MAYNGGMSNTDKEKAGTVPTSVRVTPTCKALWDALADRVGLSNAKYLEVLIREKARAEGVTADTEKDQVAA